MKKAIVVCETGHRAAAYPTNTRSVGAHNVADLCSKHGYETETVDFFAQWEYEDFESFVLGFFANADECIMCFSSSIVLSAAHMYTEAMTILKPKLTNCTVVAGGLHGLDGKSHEFADVLFLGRSEIIFEMFLRHDLILENHRKDDVHGSKVYKHVNDELVLHEPLMLRQPDTSFCTNGDVLTVEMGIGCKFNCTFCNYDFKQAPKQKTQDPLKLAEVLQYNYDKYGVTHYFLGDDTLNEVDGKLIALAEAVDKLTFTPHFSAYIRLDILNRRRHQLDLLKAANVHSHLYGIETLNPAAGKIIGKNPSEILDALLWVKEEFPACYTFGSFIMGLTGDSEEKVWEAVETIAKHKALTAAGCQHLHLRSGVSQSHVNHSPYSSIEQNPAKYGYTIKDLPGHDRREIYWENDWTNRDEAKALARKVEAYYEKNLHSHLSNSVYFTMHALGVVKDKNTVMNPSDAYLYSRMHMQKYIQNKLG